MNIKRTLVLIVLLVFSFNLFAKIEKKNLSELSYLKWEGISVKPKQEMLDKYNPQESIWLSFTETLGLNILLWSYNRYITDAGHSKISLSSMKKNIKHGFDFDADSLSINFWGHPFQGAMYYNTARSLGYDYFTSMTVTAFGSLQWEFFMEIEPAAVNDFIITTMAGAIFGEIFYRLSSLLIDESSKGAERVAREISAGAFNPGRLVNRLFFSRSSRSLTEELYSKEKYSLNMALGVNTISDGVNIEIDGRRKNMVFDLVLIYGSLFKKKRYKPFDYFTLEMMLNLTKNKQPFMGSFLIDSIFYGKRFNFKNHSFIFSINQNFDYMENNIYKIAALDLGGVMRYGVRLSEYFALFIKTGLYFIPMGGVNSDYSKYYLVDSLNKSRDYNVSFGASSKSSLVLVAPYTLLKLDYLFWWFKTFQGARGNEIIGVIKPSLSFRFWGRFKLGIQYFIYHRKGKYSEFPDINSENNEKRVFISFDF